MSYVMTYDVAMYDIVRPTYDVVRNYDMTYDVVCSTSYAISPAMYHLILYGGGSKSRWDSVLHSSLFFAVHSTQFRQ
jgi:hypothetical protein